MMKGIQTLEEFCNRKDIPDLKEWINRAIQELKSEGPNASHALAKLIKELLDCRNTNLPFVLIVALEMEPSSDLIEAIRSIISAPNLTDKPDNCRFISEISKENLIGWNDRIAEEIKLNADIVHNNLLRKMKNKINIKKLNKKENQTDINKCIQKSQSQALSQRTNLYKNIITNGEVKRDFIKKPFIQNEKNDLSDIKFKEKRKHPIDFFDLLFYFDIFSIVILIIVVLIYWPYFIGFIGNVFGKDINFNMPSNEEKNAYYYKAECFHSGGINKLQKQVHQVKFLMMEVNELIKWGNYDKASKIMKNKVVPLIRIKISDNYIGINYYLEGVKALHETYKFVLYFESYYNEMNLFFNERSKKLDSIKKIKNEMDDVITFFKKDDIENAWDFIEYRLPEILSQLYSYEKEIRSNKLKLLFWITKRYFLLIPMPSLGKLPKWQ